MAFLNSNQIKKGTVILHKNEPTLVLSHDLHATGRGGAHNKTKLKGLISGAIVATTFSGNEKAEEVEVLNKNIQFLYSDDKVGYFMDPVSFEQMEVLIENIPGEKDYLKEGILYQGVFYEDKIISIMLPKKLVLQVTEAYDATKGDSSNNPQKEVTLETGAKIKVPLFIKKGELINVNTEFGSYDSKA